MWNRSQEEQDIRAAFEQLDTYLTTHVSQPLLSLAPDRDTIRNFTDNAPLLLKTCQSVDVCLTIAEQFEQILLAQLKNFPENIFWDFDYLLHAMASAATEGFSNQQASIQSLGRKIADLLHLFGENTPIRFRYVHDFTYGFDWAKWVKKDMTNRQDVLPFSHTFLDALTKRGLELLKLIEENDQKYHQLLDEKHRNPFIFSREPEDELKLLSCLASDNHVPVAVWDYHTSPHWQLPYGELRKKCSERLGISNKTA